jgi:Xaa-Pro aminopeptidase
MMNQKDSLKKRRNSIIEEVQRRGFESVVFFNEVIRQNPSNFIYFFPSGLGDEHQTIVMDHNGEITLVTPHWGAPEFEASGKFTRIIPIKQEKGHHIKGTLKALKDINPEKICFDLSTISAQMVLRMSKEIGVHLELENDISDHVFKLRSIKDEFEINEIKRAISITEAAFMMLIEETRPGRCSVDMKKELDANMIELGAYEFSFDSAIYMIKGTSLPAILKHGDALCLDVGVRVETGYCSDMGRNWHVTIEQKTQDYMERAMQAQVEGIKNIKEGVTGNMVLERANELNKELGFHPTVRTGHQIGLDCHDYTMPFAPSFGPIETDNQLLKAGMTLTYEPNRRDLKNGYRGHVEDIILVTKNGAESLNEMPYNITW